MKSISLVLLALPLSACASIHGGGDLAYRVRVSDGTVVQCTTATDTTCGLVLSGCSNKHEYHCLPAIDVELSEPNAPLPAPQQRAQAPAPAPTPEAAPAPAAPAPTPKKK